MIDFSSKDLIAVHKSAENALGIKFSVNSTFVSNRLGNIGLFLLACPWRLKLSAAIL